MAAVTRFIRSSLPLVNGDAVAYPTSVFMQCVRWRRHPRKPRWLPTAKSKMFRVPERRRLPKDEHDELLRLFNNYRSHMKALSNYFKEELAKYEEQAVKDISSDDKIHEEAMKLNNEWNAQVAKLRDERLAKESEERKKVILENLIAAEQLEKENLSRIEERIRKEKVNAKMFITAENIDEAIENALSSEVDYNFAIDLEGNIFRGRFTNPKQVSSDKLEKTEISAQAS
ncbi:small ribosomal subunit protein mS26 [Bacillus rossius redtenbacheri]|uniref:small ribosomal subunit protein mS26 n=1 Tax=Bacillus rossius redtenbacheri TaxID=93214 RepID=UPI002FDEC7A6